MAPNGTSTTLSLPVENTSTHLKSSMDNVDAPTNDRTPVSSTASSACPPLPLSPIVPVQRPTNYWPMLNMKRESDRRKTYERWVVPFMDPNRLAAAGFYYINQGDVVRCVFCGVEVGHWEEGDDPFRDHQRWAPSCGFVRGLQVGNIPISQDGLPEGPSAQEASRSYDVCGPYLEFRPNSGPERAVSSGLNHNLLTPEELQKHGIHQSRGPLHPSYNTYDARVRSFESWPRSLKQKPDKLSEAGFYYTGKGDQTVCFHCGGGLKDWEETDDPWVEHAVWFPKCIHVVLIEGRTFIEECHRLKEARMPVQVTSVMLSLCFMNTEAGTQRWIQDIRGLLYLITSEVFFTSAYSVFNTFPQEIPVFLRESGLYSTSAYYFSKMITLIYEEDGENRRNEENGTAMAAGCK